MAAATSKHQAGTDLDKFDLHLLHSIYSLRYATAEHIVACQSSDKQSRSLHSKSAFKVAVKVASQNLAKLQKLGCLKRIGRPVGKLFGPGIYALGENSLSVLSRHPGYDAEEIKKQLQDTFSYLESKSENVQFLIENCLGVNLFRSALTLSLQSHSNADWVYNENNTPYWIQPTAKQNLTIQTKVKTASIPPFAGRYFNQTDEETQLQCNVDAMFILNFSDHKVGFLYKRDAGQESHEEVAANLLCHYNWFEKNQHQKAFDTSRLRVLIETYSEQRMNNIFDRLARSIKQARNESTDSPVFWFTLKNNFSLDFPSKIFEPIWRVGYANYRDQRHSLLEFTSPKEALNPESLDLDSADEEIDSV